MASQVLQLGVAGQISSLCGGNLVVAGLLLTGIGNLDVGMPGIFTQPQCVPSLFSQWALAVVLDPRPQLV